MTTEQNSTKVPHLTTALTGPLQYLESHLLERQVAIETWFRKQWCDVRPPFYCSVDLRNAGFKLAPVDTNLFPGGFNNLNKDFLPLSVQAVQATMAQICPDATQILLIPESHTANMAYFENIAALRNILIKSGFDVKLGSLITQLKTKKTIPLPSGESIDLEPVKRVDDKLVVEGFTSCIVLLNNDLSDGVPEMLQNLNQIILPSLNLGWSHRLKSDHFAEYDNVIADFCKTFELDPWLISPYFTHCDEVNFIDHTGENCLVKQTKKLLADIQEKYDEYNITQKPFVVMKADAGTYGMSVMTIQDPDEIVALNRKERVKLAKAKGGQVVTKVILQEGVYTFETWGDNESVAEPVVYMIGRHVVGGFYRVHTNRGVNENLNAPGMQFEPLAFTEPGNMPLDKVENRFYAYGVIARLALVAAARELAETEGE